MANELKTERVCIMMTPSEITAIDDWRFSNRVASRSDAIRKLLQLSLDAENATKKQAKDPGK
jgi:Arc/MetJ-type ribon-helix-helix transcriptional regulator